MTSAFLPLADLKIPTEIRINPTLPNNPNRIKTHQRRDKVNNIVRLLPRSNISKLLRLSKVKIKAKCVNRERSSAKINRPDKVNSALLLPLSKGKVSRSIRPRLNNRSLILSSLLIRRT